ncbi:hypothetical protein A5731_25405 [Mycolicibacterium conceptionense]|uniref:DUF7159 domain-containing protein n=1 Tax=Mycolicibacterium conceptionense TaxID=451644 RepID=A0A1A0PGU2_9MYCO|nr:MULTISPECIES: hypothetical protein [Mycolicibacterium]MCW1824770.1 hypothetical protein [Mycolicibacterium senegalense]OBB08948.1 hypothetical protein A5718_12505 [Mycolicibacterium conceptionense]OBE96345.1 hypothetical protein A5731_25405 [Mycolicibacterium conceptionense]OBF16687.1 hypothetical protein A5726_21520 [Mycolicibacterium conceptionense]OBF35675.1 hypothetical protein A5720_22575 [Mycolicibacterium conceptionense]
MDVVIGIAMTSRDARLLLVEGTHGDGAVIDHNSLPADDAAGVEHSGFRDRVVDAVIDTRATAPANGYTVARVALTWTDAVAAEAKLVLDALEERGITNAAAVSKADAFEAAADYTAQIGDYEAIALCVVEPEEAMLAVTGSEREDGRRRLRTRHLDGPDAATAVLALRGLCDSFPEPIDEVAIAGSAPDAENLVEEVNSVMSRPVLLGDEAALLLARGALIASADIRDDPASAVKPAPLTHTVAMALATAALIVAGSVFLAVTVRGGHGSVPPQASTTAEHAAPPSPSESVHTVVRTVVPLAGQAADKSFVAPYAERAVSPSSGVVRR